MKLRAPTAWLGTVLTVGAACAVTAQALSGPPRPHRARDIVSTDARTQAQFADVCRMYPAECRFNADGSIARVAGRRIVTGADRAVLDHFKVAIGAAEEPDWDAAALQQAKNNPKD
jgi:hypothetical protein